MWAGGTNLSSGENGGIDHGSVEIDGRYVNISMFGAGSIINNGDRIDTGSVNVGRCDNGSKNNDSIASMLECNCSNVYIGMYQEITL